MEEGSVEEKRENEKQGLNLGFVIVCPVQP
uniref:Uncharacterized protein n=1 Tax=Nelumbo nucifera TaxID=4432 RepID=A0A822XM76_NELNU|nr:TPA_asm: hypothetical protein HUJ06_022923 [Nelumbo nucifera]